MINKIQGFPISCVFVVLFSSNSVHMVLMVVLMTTKDRFTILGCETLTVTTTSQREQQLYLLYSVVHCGAPDWEVAEISPRGSLGSPCLVYKGVIMIQEWCTALKCVMQRVLSQSLFGYLLSIATYDWHDVEVVSSGKSKTIRIACPRLWAGLTMSFVISLIPLTIINDDVIGNKFSSWFGMIYSWFGDRTVQPGMVV